MNVVIIGGGLIGMATALHLRRAAPHCRVTLLEKESHVGAHQSTHNSGVLHAGLYYKPGSLKARLAVDGIRRMVAFCREHGIRHEICGKLVVATDAAEVARLRTLQERGTQNGLRDLRWLEGDELREIEPHAAGVAAVHVPEEGIVDYAGVCAAMAGELQRLDATIVTSARVIGFEKEAGGWRVLSTAGEWSADFIINCAGLFCDRIAELAGVTAVPRIMPFRGEYYELKPAARARVRNLIYPVPDPVFPFLGVHFTRLIGGGIEAGPNAVLAFSREGYTKWQVNPRDFLQSVSYSGLWRFIRQHRAMVGHEVVRSLSRRQFAAALQKLVPAIQEDDLVPGGSGVRAQAMQTDGSLLQDFHFHPGENQLHVLNAPSPGATASLAIGEFIGRQALSQMPSAPRPASRPLHDLVTA